MSPLERSGSQAPPPDDRNVTPGVAAARGTIQASVPAADADGHGGVVTEAPRLVPLTDDLRTFLERTQHRSTSLGELLAALEERGTAMLVILMAAPFVLPIPLPGLSMPFGVAIAILGIQLGFGRVPWLPAFLLRRPLQPSTLAGVLRAVERVVKPVERMLRPRWSFLVGPVLHETAGVAIAIAALLLFPPFPMPGINALPSLAIVLLALGLMERDGISVAAGYVVLVVSYAYLYLWWDVAVKVLRQILW
jgi:hypothetical protein